MMGHYSVLASDSGSHSLLEPPTPAYTNMTVRRALVVWLHCGQQNEFKHVCNYFHNLEILEDRLSAEQRASSRLHEFNLLSNYPPYSHYLALNFPKLYRNNKINVKKIEEIKLEDCVFNLEGYHEIKIQKGVTTKDIIKTSQIITKYCKTHSKSLKNFLGEFLDFTKKTNSSNSVTTILMFIKRRYLKDELETWKKMPKSFSFLDISDEETKINDDYSLAVNAVIKTPVYTGDHAVNANKNANKIRILINDSRRKEIMNLIPNLPELSVKKSENNPLLNENV